MLKACPYCGGVHPQGYVCPRKPERKKQSGSIEKFRNSKVWQRKREYIRSRDRSMCRCCADGYGGEEPRYVPADAVHHIEPLAEAWELRLEDGNLICLCGYHHELAERGKISRNYLKNLAFSPIFPASRAKLQ